MHHLISFVGNYEIQQQVHSIVTIATYTYVFILFSVDKCPSVEELDQYIAPNYSVHLRAMEILATEDTQWKT